MGVYSLDCRPLTARVQIRSTQYKNPETPYRSRGGAFCHATHHMQLVPAGHLFHEGSIFIYITQRRAHSPMVCTRYFSYYTATACRIRSCRLLGLDNANLGSPEDSAVELESLLLHMEDGVVFLIGHRRHESCLVLIGVELFPLRIKPLQAVFL